MRYRRALERIAKFTPGIIPNTDDPILGPVTVILSDARDIAIEALRMEAG
jgi:hypothetical protein